MDIEQAKKWYHKASLPCDGIRNNVLTDQLRSAIQAAKRGNQEAIDRLRALEKPIPTALSGDDHMFALNRTIVRKHTTAKERSDRSRLAEGTRQETEQEALKRRMQDEASLASGVQLPRTGRTDGMSTAARTGYTPALPQQGPSRLPMPVPQSNGDWRAGSPARQGVYPAHPQTALGPSASAWRPFEAPPQAGNHGRTVSSSSMPAFQAQQPPAHHSYPQPPQPRAPSTHASSASGQDLAGGLNSSDSWELLSPQPGRKPSGTFENMPQPPRSSSQSTSMTDDSRVQHRQSYALHDPGAASVPERSATLQSGNPTDQTTKAKRDNELRPPGRVQGGAYKGADTFEQMGFVSKPVSSDNDCRIM